MGQDLYLEFEKHSQAEPTCGIIKPSCHSNDKAEKRQRKGQPSSKFHFKNSDSDFRELCLDQIANFRCKSMHSRTPEAYLEENVVLKRGSVYQSSSEVRRIRKFEERRRKVECTNNEDTFLSFEIVDSLPQSSNAISHSQKKQKPVVSSNAEPKCSSLETTHPITRSSMEFLDLSFRDLPDKHLKPDSSCSDFSLSKPERVDDLLEICLDVEETKDLCKNAPPKLLETGPPKGSRYNRCQRPALGTNGYICNEGDMASTLPKSFSAKAGIYDFPGQSQGILKSAGPKVQSSPLKKMLEPITKSKSMRNSSIVGTEEANAVDPVLVRKNRILNKSLLSDGLLVGDQVLTTASSPAHLHAVLKSESNDGVSNFEFSVKDPEDILSAKTWKTENAFNWVYTFHSCNKKINKSGRATKEKQGYSPPTVGQMQVSCYLCSEVGENGSLNNSAVTEFILYDIAQARRSFAVERKTKCLPDSIQPPLCGIAESLVMEGPLGRKNSMERQHNIRHALNNSCNTDASTSYPWSQADLHPHLETAAITIQVPFNKMERFKDMKAEGAHSCSNLSNVTSVDQGREKITNNPYPVIVKAVTPSGTHGLPNAEECGPSSLLDRWRLGGGCDCGGWDMACPLVVFDNCGDDTRADCLTMESKKPFVLCVQGSKEKVPALSIMVDGNGQYSVDFHAQLSALQAFSICIAVLHFSEASVIGQEKNAHKLNSSSLKLLLEEEVRHLIEAVAVEEKRKMKKKVEQVPPSFFLDPPFSPIGRV
ncbi:uncharacterized protein [Typha angustifolia]|uniref:uncharacterized protein n=1 Tax=Typha angustifolia TaxID=59011 RepID=UPI003C2B66FF